MGEKNKNASSKHAPDPFTSFMFGGRSKNDKQTDMNQWLFGRKIRAPIKEKNEMDIDTLLKSVDQLTEITQEFKPLWKKISPHVNKFIK